MDNIFSYQDILWIKNVTDKTTGTAYLDAEDIFTLHSPNSKRKNILTPNIGDIILIRQKVYGKPAFTHLVTPIDSIERIEKRDDYKYGRKVKTIAKVELDKIIPVSHTLWQKVKFNGIPFGNYCNLRHVESINNLTALQIDIWNRFSIFLSPNIDYLSNEVVDSFSDEIEIIGVEGKKILAKHYVIERNKKVIEEKKKLALKSGVFFCEVCNFSFFKKYGLEYLECHHIKSLSSHGGNEIETKLEDLALVCANCHRMLHKSIDGKFLTILELQSRLM